VTPSGTNTETATSTWTPTETEQMIATPFAQTPPISIEQGQDTNEPLAYVNADTHVGSNVAIIGSEDVGLLYSLAASRPGIVCNQNTPAFEIYLLAGTYFLPNTLNVFCNTIIYGRNADITVFKPQDGIPPFGELFFIANNAFLEFHHVTLEDGNSSTVAGAVYVNTGSTLRAYDSRFISNYTDGSGGAIYMYGAAQFHFSRNVFENNTAGDSGGVITSYGFSNNYATLNGDCNTFRNNAANTNGGLLHLGGALWVAYTLGRITNGSFEDNVAYQTTATSINNHIYRYLGPGYDARNNYWRQPMIASNQPGVLVEPVLSSPPTNCATQTAVPLPTATPTSTPTPISTSTPTPILTPWSSNGVQINPSSVMPALSRSYPRETCPRSRAESVDFGRPEANGVSH
jgi:predicted outer membrane repeat protein